MSDNWGIAILAMGEQQAAENKAARLSGSGSAAASAVLNQQFNEYVFRAKSHVHGFRALVDARKQVEDELIAALKAVNANHPLASREAVEAAVEVERIKALLNPEVVKRTYPDGKLPKGAVGGDPLGSRAID